MKPEGRAIAEKVLNEGERKALERVKRAIRKRSEGDPIVQYCLEKLAEIASGKHRRRFVGDEYRALVHLLDRTEGKPKDRTEHTGEITVRIVEADDGAA